MDQARIRDALLKIETAIDCVKAHIASDPNQKELNATLGHLKAARTAALGELGN